MPLDNDTAEALTTRDAAARNKMEFIWRAFFPLLAPMLIVAGLYVTTTLSLVRTWNDFDSLGNTHGWLILAVVIWLLYDQAKLERKVVIQPTKNATLALALLSLAWFLFIRVNVLVGQMLLLPLLILAVLAAIYGVSVARRCWFPIGYLYFAIPFWGLFNPLFQWGTVFAMRILLRALGIPAYFQGNELHLPAGMLTVEGGCSGLHYFVVAMAIAFLYWHMNGVKRPGKLLALAAGLAILSNWARVLVITIAGYMTNMQHYLVRVDHYKFGWVVFAMAMGVFFFFAGRMAVTAHDESAVSSDRGAEQRFKLQWSAAVVLAMTFGPVLQWALTMRDAGAAIVRDAIAAPPDWTAVPATGSTWQPVFANADYREAVLYKRDAFTIEVFRALYTDQRQEKKLNGYDNSIIGRGYQDESQGFVAQGLPGFASLIIADASGRKWLVLHTYFVGQRKFASPMYAQAFYGLSSILAQSRVGVLALRSECMQSCDAAASLLSTFASSLSLDSAPPLATE